MQFSKLARLSGITLVLVIALGVFAVGATAQEESVLVLAFEQEGPNLDPLNSLVFGELPENLYTRDLWEWDQERGVVPVMAEDIPTADNGGIVINEDGDTEVTVTLREGIVWSDGTPITTADCEVWHRIRTDPSTSDNVARGSYPDAVKDFEIIDDRTFVVTFNGVFPDVLAKASTNEGPNCPYPAHLFGPMIADGGKLEDSDYFTLSGEFEETIGYGPYKLVEWNIGQDMTFVRNEFWDGEEPGFDRVIVRFITDDTQTRNALEVGEVDAAFNWSDDLQPSYAAIDNVQTFNVIGVFADALWMRTGSIGNDPNHGGDALEDPTVRMAIVHALDRLTFAEQLVGPGIDVPKSWYPPTLWPDDLPFLEFNVDEANRLLDEAGWVDSNGDGTRDKDGVELANLRFVTTENTLRNNYQLVIQEALAEVGIGTDIQIIPATNLFASFADRGVLTNYEWDLAIFANSADPLSPLTDRDSYSCAGIPSAENPDGFNPWQFCNERYDEVDMLIQTTLPGAERDALSGEAVTLFYEGQFWHALRLRNTWWAIDTTVLDPETVDGHVGTLAANWLNQIEFWKPAS